MKKIEFIKMDQSFEEMKNQVPEYKTEEWFAQSVEFVRTAEYFTEIMEAFPEDHEDGYRRVIGVDESMR